MNTFVTESQIDTMAAQVGEDPLAFRLRNLTDPRKRRVLQSGFGLACNIDAAPMSRRWLKSRWIRQTVWSRRFESCHSTE
jgi:CO/xanthine dehydrogenase Mo-binding subunit